MNFHILKTINDYKHKIMCSFKGHIRITHLYETEIIYILMFVKDEVVH